MQINDIKKRFEIFKIYKDLVYLDSAATTHKPIPVVESMSQFYNTSYATADRGLYPLSLNASRIYEKAREKVANFINAKPEEIIFTASSTDSLNLILALLTQNSLLKHNDKVLLTRADHSSATLPFQNYCKNIEFAKVNLDGDYDLESVSKTAFKVASLPLTSNVTGYNLEGSISINTNFLILDASQSVGHIKVDVKALDCDFLSFSAHKMYGPMGIGVLFVKESLLKKLKPVKFGGGAITNYSNTDIEFASGVKAFEPGTPNIAGAVGLASAIDFINSIGILKIQAHEQMLKKSLLNELSYINEIKIVSNTKQEGSIVTFYHDNVHAHDIADYLGQKEICVRAGNHCAHMFQKQFGIPATVRASFGLYNSQDDINSFIEELKQALMLFKKQKGASNRF